MVGLPHHSGSRMGVGDMKTRGVVGRIILLSVFTFLGSVSYVYSQDFIHDLQEVKSQVSDLKNQVSELRTLVYGLREAILKNVTAPKQRSEEQTPSKVELAKQKESETDPEELTRAICPAVGKFFREVDASLRASSDSAAMARMKKAFKEMNASLSSYVGTHRVNKLLNIYEDLAWNTYVAVELRRSIQGNEDFIKVLNRHRQKYREGCEKKK
jgi:hypothetical protein